MSLYSLAQERNIYGRDVIKLCVGNIINDGVEAQQGNLRLFFPDYSSLR